MILDFYLAGGDEPIKENVSVDALPRSGEWVFLADEGGWRTVRHLRHDVLLNRVEVHLTPSDHDKNRGQ